MMTRDHILAGDCTLTIETPAGDHRTYRVQHSPATDRWKESWFVKLLTGSDNTSDYSYVGKLDSFTGQVTMTAKSKYTLDSFPVKLLNRVLARVWADDHDAYDRHGFKVHHEGTCCRCGRKLTTPESVTSGVGPECAKVMGLDRKQSTTVAKVDLFNVTTAEGRANIDAVMAHLGDRDRVPGSPTILPSGMRYTGD